MVRFVDNSVKFVEKLSFFALLKTFSCIFNLFHRKNFFLLKLHKSAHFVYESRIERNEDIKL